MVKRRELTENERVRIKTLHDAGWSLRKIGKDIKCSHSVVKYTLQTIAETGLYKIRQGRGRKRVLEERDVRQLTMSSTRDRRKTTLDLQAEVNDSRAESQKVSRSTISRRLREAGLYGRVAAKKPLLRPQNIQKRLEFARRHQDWSAEEWRKVLWTDESKFEIFSQHRRVFVCRMPGERFHESCIVPTVKHGGGSIMVWGSVCGNGVGKLIKIDGIMDKNVYHNILVRHAIPSGLEVIGHGFIYQQDNDPKHTSKLCTNYLVTKQESGVLKLMNWPSQSPDLNPIEQIWDLIDSLIDRRNVSSKGTLWEQIQAVWRSITKETLQNYIDTMPARIEAVIKAKGGHTKY